MGQIKNIKLHIVTDIKFSVRTMVKGTASMSSRKKTAKRELDGEKKESPAKKIKNDKENKFRNEYHSKLKEKLLVDMPDDFYMFHEFLQDTEVLDTLAEVGLHCTGPYDILND